MKEDTRIDGPWEHGVQPAPALKETLTLAMSDVKEGMTELELAEKYGAIWSRNYRALERYRTLCTNRHRSEKTHVTVLFGPSGTGKSRSAFEGFPGCYTKPKGEWWNGYDSHPHVVIDEFYGWLPGTPSFAFVIDIPFSCRRRRLRQLFPDPYRVYLQQSARGLVL